MAGESSSHRSIHIPAELVTIILEEVDDKTRAACNALYSACLVSKLWLACARPLLYRSVRLFDPETNPTTRAPADQFLLTAKRFLAGDEKWLIEKVKELWMSVSCAKKEATEEERCVSMSCEGTIASTVMTFPRSVCPSDQILTASSRLLSYFRVSKALLSCIPMKISEKGKFS